MVVVIAAVIPVFNFMECKYCHVMMEFGTAIRGNFEMQCFGYINKPAYTWDTLDVVRCWKCPKCGHSEYLDNDD